LTFRARFSPIMLPLAAIAGTLIFAQSPVLVRPDRAPGRPPQMVVPQTPPPTGDAAPISIVPGPDPWYTLFATGEVVGYIEPCG